MSYTSVVIPQCFDVPQSKFKFYHLREEAANILRRNMALSKKQVRTGDLFLSDPMVAGLSMFAAHFADDTLKDCFLLTRASVQTFHPREFDHTELNRW